MSKTTTCECGSVYRTCDKKRHLNTKNHLNFINTKPVVEDNTEDNWGCDGDDNTSQTDFLDGLNNDKYISQTEIDLQNKQIELERKEQEKINKQNTKMYTSTRPVKNIRITHKEDVDDEDDLFSAKPTIIHGKEKLVLIKKCQSYKIMFKNELKTFKIKKNATAEELNNAIDEMQNIIECTSTDEFITEGILQSLKLVEGVTANYKNYNLSGLSDMLKLNPEFKSLCKQLYLKYGSFTNISPEYKMIFLVSTTAYIVKNKNKNKIEINDFLDGPSNLNINNIK